MSDDDDAYYPLFPTEDIERWKRRELPPIWLEQQKDVLLARYRTQSDQLSKMLASADEATINRFNRPL
ncbi:hypothetical protein WEU32_02290 [Brevundimonas sp. BH3]|uniref:hypothetical protein n=1 Tax=Brevundimonas sp. BH3 TaxID=3133089 RepID=UPI003251328C